MDQIFDCGAGIVMTLGLGGVIWLKRKKRVSGIRDRNEDEYWAGRQAEYDAPVVVESGSDDSDSGSGDN